MIYSSFLVLLLAVAAIAELSPPARAARAAHSVLPKQQLGCSDGSDCTCSQCGSSGYSYFCASNNECYNYEASCGWGCSGKCLETGSGCGGCSDDGHNCKCNECGSIGYSYHCAADSECYSTYATCDVECSGSCVATSACLPPTSCSAAQTAKCGSEQTCCISGTAPYEAFCASSPDATCCGYKETFCAKDMACNPAATEQSRLCLPADPKPSFTCKSCRLVVDKLEDEGGDKGCELACGLIPPPGDAVCEALMKYGLCDWIEDKLLEHLKAEQICDMLGACSSGKCACGYCTPDYFGQWCLGVDHACPSSSSTSSMLWKKTQLEKEQAKHQHALSLPPGLTKEQKAVWVQGLRWRVPHVVLRNLTAHQRSSNADPQLKSIHNVEEYCADGMCEAKNAGCCLTCAP